MEVDVIMVMDQGVVTNLTVIKATGTAEAIFDGLAEKLLGSKEYNELVEDDWDYDRRYEWVNQELEGQGKEICWFCRIKVNKFK